MSQIQPEVEDGDSDDKDSDPVAVRYSEGNFYSVVDDVNGVLNPGNNDDRDELHSILGHRFIAGILEMQVS